MDHCREDAEVEQTTLYKRTGDNLAPSASPGKRYIMMVWGQNSNSGNGNN